jgi:hypothetical protein
MIAADTLSVAESMRLGTSSMRRMYVANGRIHPVATYWRAVSLAAA